MATRRPSWLVREDNLRILYEERLRESSDFELIERFNREARGAACAVRARMIYLHCLYAEFDSRGFDYSCIQSQTESGIKTINLNCRVHLEGKRLVRGVLKT